MVCPKQRNPACRRQVAYATISAGADLETRGLDVTWMGFPPSIKVTEVPDFRVIVKLVPGTNVPRFNKNITELVTTRDSNSPIYHPNRWFGPRW